MAYLRHLSPKILYALHHQFMEIDPNGSLSVEELIAKIKIKENQNQIHAGLNYLTSRNYIQSTSENAYQITPDGIDYYEDLMSSTVSEKTTVTVHGDNSVNNVTGNEQVNIRFPKLSRTMKRRIFDILTQVGELFTYLKKQNVLNKESEEKFSDWYSELENIIHFHDLTDKPSKKDKA